MTLIERKIGATLSSDTTAPLLSKFRLFKDAIIFVDGDGQGASGLSSLLNRAGRIDPVTGKGIFGTTNANKPASVGVINSTNVLTFAHSAINASYSSRLQSQKLNKITAYTTSLPSEGPVSIFSIRETPGGRVLAGFTNPTLVQARAATQYTSDGATTNVNATRSNNSQSAFKVVYDFVAGSIAITNLVSGTVNTQGFTPSSSSIDIGGFVATINDPASSGGVVGSMALGALAVFANNVPAITDAAVTAWLLAKRAAINGA